MALENKIKQARKLLNMSQVEAAQASGLQQNVISDIERGKKVFIPTDYLSFLQNKGIDINSLFNNDVPVHFKNDAVLNPKNPFNNDILRKNIIEVVDERLTEKMAKIEEILYTMLADIKAKELKNAIESVIKTTSKAELDE
ncbi:helix-turn-helix domain-containing protein [Kordia sp. TARA_039_SRF]|nr:helix-turn-helix domain-containing protein [Kordia sp. TARA_039_SRF]